MFRSEDMTYALTYIKNMFGLIDVHDVTYNMIYYGDYIEIFIFITAILCAMPFFKNMIYKEKKCIKFAVNIWLLLLFIISAASIANSTYNPFIYFRF